MYILKYQFFGYLWKKLICKLLGSDNAIIIVDTQRYFEKFNNLYKNKILKIFEEIKEKGSAFHNHNRIKGEMTNDLEIIEKKGMDQVQCRNFARIIMNSNNENYVFYFIVSFPHLITDRRFDSLLLLLLPTLVCCVVARRVLCCYMLLLLLLLSFWFCDH